MENPKPPMLSDLIESLTSDVVEIQQKLDAHFTAEYHRFEQWLDNTPKPLHPYLQPLAPKPIRVSRHEVSARVQWHKERVAGGSLQLGIQLLNFSSDIRFQRDTSQDCQLKLCIEQAPVMIDK